MVMAANESLHAGRAAYTPAELRPASRLCPPPYIEPDKWLNR